MFFKNIQAERLNFTLKGRFEARLLKAQFKATDACKKRRDL